MFRSTGIPAQMQISRKPWDRRPPHKSVRPEKAGRPRSSAGEIKSSAGKWLAADTLAVGQGSCKKAGWNLQNSPLPGKTLEGIGKRALFLQKSSKEFTKESPSWKITRRNWQKITVTEKKLEGINKTVPFLENNSKELAKESRSCRKAGRNS